MNNKFKKVLALFLCMTMILSCGFYSSNVNASNTKLQLSTKSITLTKGDTKTIKVKKAKNVKISKIKYVSKNKKIATVTNNGKVTAKKVGKTTIYTTIKYKLKKKSYSKKFKTSVVVTKNKTTYKVTNEKQTTENSVENSTNEKSNIDKPTTTEKTTTEAQTTENTTTTEIQTTEQPTTPTVKPCAHEYGTWTITQEQTCTQYVQKYRICKKCGYKDTYTGNTYADHNYEKVITQESTPVLDGKYQIKCTKCGSIKETGIIKATGYGNCPKCNIPMKAKEFLPPTCEENGYVITTCDNCGYTSDKQALLTKGHNDQTVYTSPYHYNKEQTFVAKCINCNRSVTGGTTKMAKCSKNENGSHEFVKTKDISSQVVEAKCKYCNKIEYFSSNLDHFNCTMREIYNSISDVETPNVMHGMSFACIYCGDCITGAGVMETEKHSLKLVAKNKYANEYKCSICNETFYVKN